VTAEEHIELLERDVAEFARHLNAAQEAGVSHALIIPRLMLAYRNAFGEVELPPLLATRLLS